MTADTSAENTVRVECDDCEWGREFEGDQPMEAKSAAAGAITGHEISGHNARVVS